MEDLNYNPKKDLIKMANYSWWNSQEVGAGFGVSKVFGKFTNISPVSSKDFVFKFHDLSHLVCLQPPSSYCHPLPPLWLETANMPSTCGAIVLRQQCTTTTLKSLNEFRRKTSIPPPLIHYHPISTSFLLLCTHPFASLFGLRCLTTMKLCLAARIRQR